MATEKGTQTERSMENASLLHLKHVFAADASLQVTQRFDCRSGDIGTPAPIIQGLTAAGTEAPNQIHRAHVDWLAKLPSTLRHLMWT